ncbi:MAG: PilN domain-containing protein [Cellvibrio sp.]
MAKINLLPWRQAYREQKRREFIVVLALVAGAALVAAFLWKSNYEAKIENQNARNQLLQKEIAILDKQVQEIAKLKKTRDDLLARIRVIQGLEGTRPLIVRYFDELVRIVPDGLWITSLDKKGNTISVEGVAESYNRIAGFMRNIDDSEWFTGHNLTSVVASPRDGEQANSFKMTFLSVEPEQAKPATEKTAAVNASRGR